MTRSIDGEMAPPRGSLNALNAEIHACRRCPRLRDWSVAAAGRKNLFPASSYWSRPVSGFGDPDARLMIVGLAPGAHGANRTGRPFTGDAAGQWLYRVLYQYGFCNRPDASDRNDGLVLTDAYITNILRCVPPADRPERGELDACHPFMEEELRLLPGVKIVLTLGQVVFARFKRLMGEQGHHTAGLTFAHGKIIPLGPDRLWIASYHCSQRNTRTGCLTWPMWDAIFARVQKHLGEPKGVSDGA